MHASVDLAYRNGLNGFRNLSLNYVGLNYEREEGRYDTEETRTSHEFT
jgi:hypothetical protein